jgi:hypothetical protein
MSDLAHRLRESAKETFYDPLKSELNEAASHIEKLEAALREIVKINPFTTPEGSAEMMELVDCILSANSIAQKALEGKDD